ncbi:helix-turn-helix transcriptional regulator [Umboniibacter marinipuniceus]|uniref:Putative DNA-binding transcriptional regulator YafY n=1 Tax=Umboniibacter marinipuniceus TaxID=569599 RepID=A0A3M0AJ13_9GAMM|nr:WYL domain-containing protein [Umboniibacter marinipuniceus]RMA82708.1 putative DNA-binding transcriptional regulator YafY [Umboniibacter marinipuniceus]
MGWPLRWDLLFRYRLIEIIAKWEGRLTTTHLTKGFGISRQQASKDINSYLAGIAPGNLVYDKHAKGYVPSSTFQPELTVGTSDEYLHLLARSSDISASFEEIDMGFRSTVSIKPTNRNIDPEILKPIVQAIREKKRVDINYTSLSSGEMSERIVSPHSLVCTPIRWHFRGYCEKARDYRDFVLSRVHGIPDINDKASFTESSDQAWRQRNSIEIIADRRLTTKQKSVIEKDYGMIKGKLIIDTRSALIKYVLDAYNINPELKNDSPLSQQIEVGNLEEIAGWLPVPTGTVLVNSDS